MVHKVWSQFRLLFYYVALTLVLSFYSGELFRNSVFKKKHQCLQPSLKAHQLIAWFSPIFQLPLDFLKRQHIKVSVMYDIASYEYHKGGNNLLRKIKLDRCILESTKPREAELLLDCSCYTTKRKKTSFGWECRGLVLGWAGSASMWWGSHAGESFGLTAFHRVLHHLTVAIFITSTSKTNETNGLFGTNVSFQLRAAL